MKKTTIKINENIIGEDHKPFIIAEVGQAHDGSLGVAHSFIEYADNAGADAVKFQTHIADSESTLDDEFRIKFSYQDATRYDYWKRMEFTKSQWLELKKHCDEKNIVFLSSPFSYDAISLLEELNVPAWKVASGEALSNEFILKLKESRLPIIISTGMMGYQEIDEIVKSMGDYQYAIMQCTSKYPTPLAESGINVVENFKQKYNCPIGLSDHSGTVWPALYSIANGIDMIEVHLAIEKSYFGPDTSSSITFDELGFLCDSRDKFDVIKNAKVDKDSISNELEVYRKLFGKSLAPTRQLNPGEIIDESMITLKKPGTGIKESDIDKLIGKTILNEIPVNRLIKWSDINTDE